jgi:triphosphatase
VADPGPRETELKFLLGRDDLARIHTLPRFARPGPATRLRSVYFDTPDADLWAAGFTLRVREASGAFVQSVKRGGPADGVTRGEWENPVASRRLDLSALAKTPVADVLNGREGRLRAVFTTTVRRTTWMWRRGSAAVEVSLDEGDVRAAARAARILELELELKAGPPSLLFEFARQLIDAVPLRLSFASKAARGYRLAGGGAPTPIKAEKAEIPASMSAVAAFRRVARGCLAHISANAELLRSQRRNAEALHEMRVGLRRFRAALSAFRPLLAEPGLGRAEAETKWLAGELDGARDLDVFIGATFGSALGRAPRDQGMAALGARLNLARSRAYDRAVAAIESPRMSRLLLETTVWIETGAGAAGVASTAAAMRREPIGAFARRALDRLRKTVRRRGRRFGALDSPGRHKLRIRVKRLRYAAEFFASAFGAGKRRRKLFSALGSLQDALGELNDIATAPQIAAAAAGNDAEAALAAGRAIGARERGEKTAITAAARALRALDDVKPFWRP